MTAYSSLSYAQPTSAVRTPRATEYEIIARVTHRLSQAAARRKQDYPAFAAALSDNERLWSTLAEDVVDDGNGLPRQLRARLFYLFRFTTEHSRKVRAGTANPEVLVEINTAVLRGLRGEGAST